MGSGGTFDAIIEITPRGYRSPASTRIGDGKHTANNNPVVLFQRCK